MGSRWRTGRSGSTALWHPFQIGDEEERKIAFSTGPGWRKPDDANIVLAMLRESHEAMAETLRCYSSHHVMPHVDRYHGRRRMMNALVRAGGEIVDDERGDFTLPPDVVAEGIAAGLIVYCEEHHAPELAAGITPERVEDWIAARGQGNS